MSSGLLYKVKRFFCGESGIVLNVTACGDKHDFPRDDNGRLPQKVCFKNPLGEIVISHSEMVCGKSLALYKEYKPGDNFP
jgi:hypothetical protein